MGNEESQHRKLEIDDKSVEVTDNWSLHFAKEVGGNVFAQSAFISHLSEETPTALERLAKNLMLHRHPCILKYISSWSKNGQFHLITEKVQPLSLILPHQSALQICVGLHSILSAIIFLHEKALSSHNNICCASVYVTSEGTWKLGGLEYMLKYEPCCRINDILSSCHKLNLYSLRECLSLRSCIYEIIRFSDVTSQYLKHSRSKRYEKAVPPEEDSVISTSNVNAPAIDKYAFGVLVEELLKKKSSNEVPFLSEFLEYTKKHLQNSNPDSRVDLSDVVQHPIFNHDFIKISKFLFDLPLKTSIEKEQFFSDLTEQLYLLPEDVVACQLTSLLLSRVVLLDSTAQKHLLPVLLQPKIEDKQNEMALFSEEIFKKYIIPKLLDIFRVRDAQIRIILLNNFHFFCHAFTLEELRNHVLPELLVGIKDVNDHLVSATLKALSQLVIILGASTVIGGKRGKLFTDGRPKSLVAEVKSKTKGKTIRSPAKSTTEVLFTNNCLPERLSPDGGEDKSSSSSGEESNGGETEHWSDWELSADKNSPEVEAKMGSTDIATESLIEIPYKNGEIAIRREDSEITFLDIKSSANENVEGGGGDIDFFRDMEPVISKTQILSVKPSKTKFDVESDEPGNNWEGWGEDWELEDERM